MHRRVSNRDARAIIERREEFESNTGSLWGAYPLAAGPKYGHMPQGQLPQEEGPGFIEAWERAGRSLYVVYSYWTPIAWHDGERWTRPDVKYSQTTSRHQGLTPRDGTV